MVCHIGGQLGTKVVISALGMLALYMCFNGTGIWGGETTWFIIRNGRHSNRFCMLVVSVRWDQQFHKNYEGNPHWSNKDALIHCAIDRSPTGFLRHNFTNGHYYSVSHTETWMSNDKGAHVNVHSDYLINCMYWNCNKLGHIIVDLNTITCVSSKIINSYMPYTMLLQRGYIYIVASEPNDPI